MPTPIYDMLRAYAAGNPARFHMPGHKGRFLPGEELAALAALDVTEIPGAGNLYKAGAPFDAAQALWAEVFGFSGCQFLTGGSTMGLHTALSLLCRPGEGLLMDRGCHRAVYNALALLDLRPVFLERPWLAGESLAGSIPPEQVEKALEEHPDVKTVCITSPTYSGVLSNIGAISRVVHARGGRLLVDGAHGAHLPFLGLAPFWGADAVVVSAHKTLPALGQGALLFTDGLEAEQVRQMASVYGTSSPSYPILASMDLARDFMEGEGGEAYRRVACRVAALRRRFPALTERSRLSLDPTRLTLKAKNGPALARALEERGVFPEMEDGGHVVLICTAQDEGENLDRLEKALEKLRDQLGEGPAVPPPPLPERVLSPRQALFAPGRRRVLADCAGEISACQVAPYPPGVPVVAPGEVFGKKELAYLQEIGYNMQTEVQVAGRDSDGAGAAGRK
ncbi:MAG: aminotransferase class V-fold PLP-dependent enzyme [Lawsonibacter sp.]|nr:aminotransferase class V-fold PLP-dependent enzyme [Lawsonibacter sp.]